jgi:hypothetical protein
VSAVTLPSGKSWTLRVLRRSASLEVLQVRDRLARQSAQAGRAAREYFDLAKTLEGDAALDADEQATDALIRAARLSEAADGWVIQAVWTGAPLGPTQGPEATGAAMLDALDALGWSSEDVSYLAAASLVALCVTPAELPAKLALLAQAASVETVAVDAATETAAAESAVIREVAETVPFGEAPGVS